MDTEIWQGTFGTYNVNYGVVFTILRVVNYIFTANHGKQTLEIHVTLTFTKWNIYAISYRNK